jgi:hypothetical protein
MIIKFWVSQDLKKKKKKKVHKSPTLSYFLPKDSMQVENHVSPTVLKYNIFFGMFVSVDG